MMHTSQCVPNARIAWSCRCLRPTSTHRESRMRSGRQAVPSTLAPQVGCCAPQRAPPAAVQHDTISARPSDVSGWQSNATLSGTADDVLSGSPLASRQPSSFHSFSSVGGSNFCGRSASAGGAGDVADELRRLRVEDFAEGPASPQPGLSVQVGPNVCVGR